MKKPACFRLAGFRVHYMRAHLWTDKLSRFLSH